MEQKIKKIFGIILLGIFLVATFVSARAYTENDFTPVELTPIQKIYYSIFGSETFSVVGDNRGSAYGTSCGAMGQPNAKLYNMMAGDSLSVDIPSNLCNSGYGLVDIWIKGWTEYIEYPNPMYFECTSTKAPCNAELYCCPNKEPENQADCDNDYTNTLFTQINCPKGTYGYRCPNEQKIDYANPSYSYCKPSTITTCYYKLNGVCYTREYGPSVTCAQMGTYSGMPLYSSKTLCEESEKCQCNYGPCTELGKDICKDGKTYRCNDMSSLYNTPNCYCLGILSHTCIEGTPTNDLTDDEDRYSLTEQAYSEATIDVLIKSMCKYSVDCSKTNILTSPEINAEEYNWTIRCVSSTQIRDTNTVALKDYLRDKFGYTTALSLQILCNSVIGKTAPPIMFICSRVKEGTNAPSGTCRATIKATSGGICWQQANTWLSPYTKSTDCQTNTFILIGILIGGLVLVSQFMKR